MDDAAQALCLPMNAHRPPGYFVVIDPEGVEVDGSRRYVSGMDPERERRIRNEMEGKMGPGCCVEFFET